jgi:hypothetical protein
MNGKDDKYKPVDDILKAEYVYLLMRKDYRISRNVRAQWLLENLNTTVCIPSREKASLMKTYFFFLLEKDSNLKLKIFGICWMHRMSRRCRAIALLLPHQFTGSQRAL